MYDTITSEAVLYWQLKNNEVFHLSLKLEMEWSTEAPIVFKQDTRKECQMTLKELVKLDEKGGIPDFLKQRWEEKHGEDPVEVAREHIKKMGRIRTTYRFFLTAGLTVGVVGLVLIVLGEIFGTLVFLLGLGTAFLVETRDRKLERKNREPSTEVGRFARNFGKLREQVDWMNYSTPASTLRSWADWFLVQQFLNFLELEENTRDFPADYTWEERTRAWEKADEFRNGLSKLHQALFELGLADDKWDRYADEAQTLFEKRRS